MTDPSSRLDQLLAAHGRMNFTLDCTSAGAPARITMDEQRLFVVTTSGTGGVLVIPFADAQLEGGGLTRTIRNRAGTDTAEIDFAVIADVERLQRVLRVRQEGVLVRAPAEHRAADRSQPAARRQRGSHGGYVRPTDLPNLYRIWHDWALLASTFLLIVAWVDLAAGAVLTLALWFRGDGLAGLIWLLVAVAGFAMPFCIGATTRMVAYRFRMQDHAS